MKFIFFLVYLTPLFISCSTDAFSDDIQKGFDMSGQEKAADPSPLIQSAPWFSPPRTNMVVSVNKRVIRPLSVPVTITFVVTNYQRVLSVMISMDKSDLALKKRLKDVVVY